METHPDPCVRVSPPRHPFERERLVSVREVEPTSPQGDPVLMRVAREVASVADAPIGFVSLVGEEGERFLACAGAPFEYVDRSDSICAYTILEPDAFVVEDLAADPRFQRHSAVVGEPYLRFYAGSPVFDATGLPLGAVCVADVRPREASSRCLLSLGHLAGVASAVMEIRILLADARARHVPKTEAAAIRTRLDVLLLALVEPRPWSSAI